MVDVNYSDEDKDEINARKVNELKEFEAKRDYPSFTDENRRMILKAIKLGVPPEKACEYAGITKATMSRWLAKGESSDDEDDPFRQFYLEVMRQDAQYMAKLLNYCSPIDNPKISLELLKLRYPQYFSTKKNVEVSGNVATDLNINEKKDRLRRMLDEQ